MNKTFLEYVAEDIISKYGTDLSRIAVVFPNKRAALFLNEHLARLAGQPVWSPAYITISDLFRQHTDLKTADPIKLICDIHKSFTKCTGIDETLDHFYGWGQLLLADFDDIDKNMADADSIFCNLKDIHELDDISYLDNEQKEMLARFFANFSDDIDSELKKRFLSLWSHFGDIYHDYNRRLTEQGIGYEGAIYRKVATEQTLHLKYDKYLFVGFNLLQKVERLLFSRLMKEGKAKFYWDFDEYYMPSPSPLPSGGALVGGYGIPAIPTQPTGSVGAPPKCTYLDIVPPKEDPQLPYVSDEMHKENQRRFALEDSIRKAYTATFPTMEEAKRISERGAEYIFKSRGNKQTIVDFINRHSDNEDRVMGILATLSDKDLRDITTEILEDSYNATTDQLSPRVEDELITIPFKQYFEKAFSKKTADAFRADPMKLVEWIKKNIRLNPDKKALRIAQTPVGVMKSKITDERSRDIFFVDVARSLGIEARKDAVTGKIQYKSQGVHLSQVHQPTNKEVHKKTNKGVHQPTSVGALETSAPPKEVHQKTNSEWQDVKFDNTAEKTSTAAALGTIVLTYEPTKLLDNPKYYSHFTISRIENGTAQLLNFDEGQADMGNGTTWSNTFKNGYKLDAGTYMLTTGTRLANGSVLASNRIFEIVKGQTTTLPLEIRQNTNEVSVIGSFNSESLVTKDGKEVSLLSQTGRGYYVVGILGVGQEPTNHALHDIEKMKEAFEAWGRPVVLLFESEADAAKFNHDEFPGLPSTVQFALDKDGSVRKQIAREMKLMNEKQMPMFIIADTFNRVVFVSQGYTIGLGEQMQGVFKKL